MRLLLSFIFLIGNLTANSQIIFVGGSNNHTYTIDTLSYENDTLTALVHEKYNGNLRAIGNLIITNGATYHHGSYVSFHENGQPASCGNFHWDKRLEPWLYWNDDGEKKSSRKMQLPYYIDGERVDFKK